MGEQSIVPNGVRDAAGFLLSLGEEAAAEVLKHLGAKDVQRIGAAISDVGQLARTQVSEMLGKFLQEAETQVSVGVGADDFIRSMLTKALGEDNAAEVLGRLPENLRPEVVARIATLDDVQPNALNQLDDIIERQFSGKVATRTASLGGAKAAANIINNLKISQEGALLGHLREMDETLASTIEELIFTFDDLLEIADRDLQELLRQVPNDQIVPALKAAEESMREKFFKNMSQRAAATLKEDLEARGPIKVSEAEAAQEVILTTAGSSLRPGPSRSVPRARATYNE